MKLLIVTALLSLALIGGCSKSDPDFDPKKYAGTYEGNWLDRAAGLTGPGQLIIAMDETTKTATISLDLGGNYLGLGDPAPTKMTGTYDQKRATTKGSDPLYGNYDIVIDGNGKITGTLEKMAGGAIPKLTFEGKLTDKRLEVDYVVHLPDGATARSSVTMAKK